MEAQAALVGADRAVKLHAVAVVYLDLALVVNPFDAEGESPLRLGQALEDLVLLVNRVLVERRLQRL